MPSSKGMSPSGLSTCGRSGGHRREPTRRFVSFALGTDHEHNARDLAGLRLGNEHRRCHPEDVAAVPRDTQTFGSQASSRGCTNPRRPFVVGAFGYSAARRATESPTRSFLDVYQRFPVTWIVLTWISFGAVHPVLPDGMPPKVTRLIRTPSARHDAADRARVAVHEMARPKDCERIDCPLVGRFLADPVVTEALEHQDEAWIRLPADRAWSKRRSGAGADNQHDKRDSLRPHVLTVGDTPRVPAACATQSWLPMREVRRGHRGGV